MPSAIKNLHSKNSIDLNERNFEQILVRKMKQGSCLAKMTSRKMPKFHRFRRVRTVLFRLTERLYFMNSEFIFTETSGQMRLDVFVSEKAEVTRSNAQKLLDDGCVLVNGKACAKNYKLHTGDTIKISIPEPEVLDVVPQDIPLDIVYEDNDIIIVNKPQGMVVHPAAGNFDGTLVNAVMFHCGNNLSAINGVIRPGIVHRIDKETSGLLVVAKNNESHLVLADMIKEHNFDREYVCLVHGNVKEDKFTVDKPIGRHPKERKMMAVTDKNSKPAVTHFEVLERFGCATLMRCILQTGRTHQIRVHLKSIGRSIVGDTVYGIKKDAFSSKYKLRGQMLHAKRLGFCHPATKEYMNFIAEVPEYFEKILEDLRK